MDYWLEAEVRARRDALLVAAERSRMARLCESGRSMGIRARLAAIAQALSDVFADLAIRLREPSRA